MKERVLKNTTSWVRVTCGDLCEHFSLCCLLRSSQWPWGVGTVIGGLPLAVRLGSSVRAFRLVVTADPASDISGDSPHWHMALTLNRDVLRLFTHRSITLIQPRGLPERGSDYRLVSPSQQGRHSVCLHLVSVQGIQGSKGENIQLPSSTAQPDGQGEAGLWAPGLPINLTSLQRPVSTGFFEPVGLSRKE